MAEKSKFRGHEIECVDGTWYFCDTSKPVAGADRPCGHCGKATTEEGHDGCLKTLPRLMNACCGHGEASAAYVQLLDGSVIRGEFAKNIMVELNEGKP